LLGISREFDWARHFGQLAFATFVLFYYTNLSVKILVLITRKRLPSKHSTVKQRFS